MSISSLITKVETGQDFKVLSSDFINGITISLGSDVLTKFGLDISESKFILEYLEAYNYILKNGLNGLSRQGFSKEVLDKVFKGFNSTNYEGTNKDIEKKIKSFKEKNPDGDLVQYIKDLNNSKIEQIGGDLTQRLGAEVAQQSGKRVVYAITRQDEKVREKHSKHDKKWWFIDTGYAPWYDTRCRCTYIYEDDTELVEALGMSQLDV